MEVFKVVKDINISKSSGLDKISSFIIKEAFKILTPEVTHMYNLSIGSSTFQSAWKEALNPKVWKFNKGAELQTHLTFTPSWQDYE